MLLPNGSPQSVDLRANLMNHFLRRKISLPRALRAAGRLPVYSEEHLIVATKVRMQFVGLPKQSVIVGFGFAALPVNRHLEDVSS